MGPGLPSWTAGHGQNWLKLAISLMVNDGQTVQRPDFAASSGKAPLPRQHRRRQRARDRERGLFKTTIFIHIWRASHIKSQLFWGVNRQDRFDSLTHLFLRRDGDKNQKLAMKNWSNINNIQPPQKPGHLHHITIKKGVNSPVDPLGFFL